VGGGTDPAGEYTFYNGQGDENHELGTVFFVHKRIISAVKRVELLSDSMSYTCIIIRGLCCHVIVLNVHAPTEDKTDDLKNSFYEELWEEIFNPLIWNESLHEISNDNGIRLVNFATSKKSFRDK
jgi:uncharacterized membrane protein YagU involved in acid resistance